MLHLGTHFSLRPGNALRSFIVLGDGNKVTLERIGTLDFRGIELVTLSACQTGLGGATNDDGRVADLLPAGSKAEPGTYRLTFHAGDYLKAAGLSTPFYPTVPVVFRVDEGSEHYHVPLLLSPYGYSTYRGS